MQVGSSIKPFIYAAALEKGLTLSSVLQDSPISIQKPGQPLWQPKTHLIVMTVQCVYVWV